MTNYLIKVTVELCARVCLCNANGRLYGHYGIASIGHICWRTRSFPTGAHTQESTSVESRIQNSPRQKEQAWKLLELTRLYRLDHC